MPETPPKELQALVIDTFAHDYDDICFLTAGGTSYIWTFVRRSLNQKRVLKVLKLDISIVEVELPDGSTISRDITDLFTNEIRHTMHLSHPNIIRLFDAGVFALGNQKLPWYIMEYIDAPLDIDKRFAKQKADGTLNRRSIVEALVALAQAVAACHAAGILHGDIKPGNIIVGQSGQLKLSDLGFSKNIAALPTGDEDAHTLWIGDSRYMDDELLALMKTQRARLRGTAEDPRVSAVAVDREHLRGRGERYDRSSLGKTIAFLWQTLDLTSIAPDISPFIAVAIARLAGSVGETPERYTDTGLFLRDLQKLLYGLSSESMAPELNLYPADAIRLPPAGRVPMTPRLEMLIDTPVLQRLRKVRQLGFTELVYPGATHTRFEHTLGVMEKALLYIRALYGAADFPFFAEAVTESDIGALVCAAALHDIGHYPLAHAFEEVEPVNQDAYKHARLAQAALRGNLPEILPQAQLASLQEILADKWGTSLTDVLAILVGAGPLDKLTRDLLPLFHSIISGPLDADKLDYLRRDSVHTGNPYGAGSDDEKFLQSIICPGPGARLAIREKGLPAVQALYMARYHMFVTVYWHHTCRAAERMLTEAVRLARHKLGADFHDQFLKIAFKGNEDDLLSALDTCLDNEEITAALLAPLFCGNASRSGIYRRVVTLATGPHPTRPADRNAHEHITGIFDSFMKGDADGAARYGLLEARIRLFLLGLMGQDARQHHVLVDIPDPRVERPDPFLVYEDPGTYYMITDRSALYRDFIQDWNVHARKVRLFAAPPHLEALSAQRELIRSTVTRLAHDIHSKPTVTNAQADEAWGEVRAWPERV